MAEDNTNNEQSNNEEKKEDDFGALTGDSDSGGLGNLPPLSDFESSTPAGGESDSGLPPLSGFDSDPAPSPGGLPPVDSIPVETPKPTGGAIKAKPPGYEESNFDTPHVQSGVDTPMPVSGEGSGFQDLAADSDFSPETPEIGPGPDSDMDTPMFDSAFGGDGGFDPGVDTPAPTQAMGEEPFGAPGFDDGGFAPDAFGDGGLDTGTPVPDFSPDTAVPGQGLATPVPPGKKAKKVKSGGGVTGILVTFVFLLIGLALGVGGGAFLADKLDFLSFNPLLKTISANEDDITRLNGTVSALRSAKAILEELDTTAGNLEELVKEVETRAAELAEVTKRAEAATAKYNEERKKLSQVEAELDDKNEQYTLAHQEYQELEGEMAIVQARTDGLSAEIDRLTSLVGELEAADRRRSATKVTLASNIEQLESHIREGIPLTPPKYNRAVRLQRVLDLKDKVGQSNWASPELLNEYTSLYIEELRIGTSTDYFFARIPVVDKIGNTQVKWAECLMNGSWSVYYLTRDGANIGEYKNVAPSGLADYEIVEAVDGAVRADIEQTVKAARVDGFEETLAPALDKKSAILEGDTNLQRSFDSL